MSSPFIKYDCTHVKRFNAKNIFMAGIKAFLLSASFLALVPKVVVDGGDADYFVLAVIYGPVFE